MMESSIQSVTVVLSSLCGPFSAQSVAEEGCIPANVLNSVMLHPAIAGVV